jgi:hypothetical protein
MGSHFRNTRGPLIAAAELAPVLLATPAFGQEPAKVSDVGNWIVVLFGLVLWASLLFTLCALGIRAMFSGRYVRHKHERNGRSRWLRR